MTREEILMREHKLLDDVLLLSIENGIMTSEKDAVALLHFIAGIHAGTKALLSDLEEEDE